MNACSTQPAPPDNPPREVRVYYKGIGAVWTAADLFCSEGRVKLFRDSMRWTSGSVARAEIGEGRWNGAAIHDCAAVLGNTESETEQIFEGLDVLLAAELQQRRADAIAPIVRAMVAVEARSASRVLAPLAQSVRWWTEIWDEARLHGYAARLFPWEPAQRCINSALLAAHVQEGLAVAFGRAVTSRDPDRAGSPLGVLREVCPWEVWQNVPDEERPELIARYVRAQPCAFGAGEMIAKRGDTGRAAAIVDGRVA